MISVLVGVGIGDGDGLGVGVGVAVGVGVGVDEGVGDCAEAGEATARSAKASTIQGAITLASLVPPTRDGRGTQRMDANVRKGASPMNARNHRTMASICPQFPRTVNR